MNLATTFYLSSHSKSLITGEDPEFERQRRLTALRFAVVSIRDFKLSFGHIQTGEGSKSDYETLWLEVDEFRVLGSKMDGLFGNPLNILLDPDIKIWVDGLSKGGGSGYVCVIYILYLKNIELVYLTLFMLCIGMS